MNEKLKTVPTEKLKHLVELIKKIRSLETRTSSNYKKLESVFKKELRRRKNEN